MREDRLLRKTVLGGLILLCLCILFSKYIHQAQGAESEMLKFLILFAKTDFGEKMPGMAPVDIIVPADNPSAGEEPKEALAPLSPAWAAVAGAQEAVLPRQLDGLSVVVLEKGEGYDNAQAVLEELPATRQLRLTISGIWGTAITDEQVKRIANDTYYCGTPPTPTPTPTPAPTLAESITAVPASPTPGLLPTDPYYVWRNDVVKAIETTVETEPDKSVTQSLMLTLDKTYVYQFYEDSWNYYIALIRPKDVYEKIVVVDAGHGGEDEGTLAAGREHMEKDINLDIVLRLKELFDAQDEITVYYTRTTDWKPSLQQRVDLANDLEADFFLSVHCNSNAMASINGTEVLYDSRQNNQEGMTSGRFAQILSEEMEEHVGFLNRGLVAREHNLTIVKYAEVPVALVEVGFLSNASDTQRLIEEQTRQDVAQALYEAVLRGYEEMEEMAEENTAAKKAEENTDEAVHE